MKYFISLVFQRNSAGSCRAIFCGRLEKQSKRLYLYTSKCDFHTWPHRAVMTDLMMFTSRMAALHAHRIFKLAFIFFFIKNLCSATMKFVNCCFYNRQNTVWDMWIMSNKMFLFSGRPLSADIQCDDLPGWVSRCRRGWKDAFSFTAHTCGRSSGGTNRTSSK